MNKDELQAIYFSFFDQLLPEHAEKAKANYEEDYWTKEPKDHDDAIGNGFDWEGSPEGQDYWENIHSDIYAKTYPLQLTPQKITVEVKEFTAPELTTNSTMPAHEWFKYLKPEHREAAMDLDYVPDEDDLTQYKCLHHALLGRKWGITRSSQESWDDIHCQLMAGTYHAESAERMATEEDRAGLEELVDSIPDSGDRSEFDTGAVRDASQGKGVPSHLPTRALMRVSQRFEDGAAKYNAHNWRKGIPLSRYVDSLNRHLWAFMQGDTTEDHLGAITWNAMCLSETYDLISEGKLPDNLNDLPEHV